MTSKQHYLRSARQGRTYYTLPSILLRDLTSVHYGTMSEVYT